MIHIITPVHCAPHLRTQHHACALLAVADSLCMVGDGTGLTGCGVRQPYTVEHNNTLLNTTAPMLPPCHCQQHPDLLTQHLNFFTLHNTRDMEPPMTCLHDSCPQPAPVHDSCSSHVNSVCMTHVVVMLTAGACSPPS